MRSDEVVVTHLQSHAAAQMTRLPGVGSGFALQVGVPTTNRQIVPLNEERVDGTGIFGVQSGLAQVATTQAPAGLVEQVTDDVVLTELPVKRAIRVQAAAILDWLALHRTCLQA